MKCIFLAVLLMNLPALHSGKRREPLCFDYKGQYTFTKYPNEDFPLKLNWNHARRFCLQKNSFLIDYPLPCNHDFKLDNSSIWTSIRKFNYFYQRMGASHEVLSFYRYFSKDSRSSRLWAFGEPREDCVAINTQIGSEYLGSFVTRSCKEELGFICMKIINNNILPLQVKDVHVKITPEHVDPVESDYDIINVEFKCSATGVIDGSRSNLTKEQHGLRYSWSYNGVYINEKEDTFKLFGSYFNIRPELTKVYQGNYRCHVHIPYQAVEHKSKAVTVKYKNVLTFIVTFTNIIKYQEADSGFSTLRYQRYIDNTLKPFMDQKVSKVLQINPKNWNLFGMWNDRANGDSNIKVHLFYNKTKESDKDFKLLRSIQDSIRSSLKQSLAFNSSTKISVSQTEYCQRLVVNESVVWPKTQALGSNSSRPPCLKNNMEIFKRSCFIDYSEGAKWEILESEICNTFVAGPSQLRFGTSRALRKLNNIICPSDYFDSPDCSKFEKVPMTWEDASNQCHKSFGQVASVDRIERSESREIWINKIESAFELFSRKFRIKWKNDAEPLPGKSCLVGEVQFQRNQEVPLLSIRSVNCSKKYPFMCFTHPMNEIFELISAGRRMFGVYMLKKKIYEVNLDEEVSWRLANKRCINSGGRLLDLEDRNIVIPLYFYIIRRMFQLNEDFRGKFPSFERKFWMGLHKKGNMYYWSNGKQLKYHLWSEDIEFSDDNIYGLFTVSADGSESKIEWNLGSDGEKFGYICQYNVFDKLNINFDEPKIRLSLGPWQHRYTTFNVQKSGITSNSTSCWKDGIAIPNQIWDKYTFNRQEKMKKLNFYQGYYWCKGKSMLTNKYVKTEKVLLINPDEQTMIGKMEIERNFSTWFSAWHRRKLDLKYFYLMEELSKNITQAMESIRLKDNQMMMMIVTDIEPIEDDDFMLSFYIIIKNMLYRKKRENYIDDHPNKREYIEFSLKSRAKNPDEFDDDTASEWLERFEVDSDSITLRNVEHCDHEITIEEDGSSLSWPKTQSGMAALPQELCVTDTNEPVIRRCLGNFTTGAYWGKVIGKCNGTASNVTQELRLLSKTADTSMNLSKNLSRLTSNSTMLKTVDIEYVTDVISKINVNSMQVETQVASNVMQSVGDVLTIEESKVSKSQDLLNTSMRLVQSIEDILYKVKLNETEPNLRIVKPKIAAEVWNLYNTSTKPVLGIADITSPMGNIKLMTLKNATKLVYNNIETAVLFPPNIYESRASPRRRNEQMRIKFIVYKNGKFFQQKNQKVDVNGSQYVPTLNTHVISASINNEKVEFIKPPVKLIFNSILNQSGDLRSKPKCVYWDMNANNKNGGWSTAGCSLKEIKSGRFVCVCDHLTNFAVIVDLYGQNKNLIPETHKKILSIITYVGCTLSVIGLSLTIMTFVLFKKWRKSLSNQIHVNLAMAMLMSIIVFIMGTDRKWHVVHHTCILVAVLLHYFLLVSFLWMLIEAVKHYLFFVKVMNTYIPSFMKKSMIIAWGLPMIIVGITLAVDYTSYSGGEYYCWMQLKEFYFAFLLPMGTIMITNVILFVRVTYALIFDRQQKKIKLRTNQPEQKDLRIRFYAAVGIFILSGATWSFAFFAVSDARLTFQYLFCIFNSLQGFFIFFLMVFKERNARNFWENTIRRCCKLQKDDKITSYSSSSATQNRSGYSNENKTGFTHHSNSSSSANSSVVRFSKRGNGVKVLPQI